MTLGHLDRVESAPGNSHHAYVAVGPGLLRKPIDHFQPVLLLLVRVFAVRRAAFACAGAADIDASRNVTSPHPIQVQVPVARKGPIVFPVWQVFENGGKLVLRLRAVRHIEIYRQSHAILHRNCRLNFLHRGIGRRNRLRREAACDKENKAQDERDPDG